MSSAFDWTSWTYLKSAAVIAALFVFAPANAQEVAIRSESGGLELTGRVAGYDGEFLQLETGYGPLTLSYAGVSCEGAACPDRDNYVPMIRLSGAARMTAVLMPALVDAFARKDGLSAVLRVEDTDHFVVDLTEPDGSISGIFTFRATSSAEGFADLITLQTDIVMSMREATQAEVARISEVGLGNLGLPEQGRIVGLDALVPVTAAGANSDVISLRDLGRAYHGDVKNWIEIGGPDLPITLHLGALTDGQAQSFATKLAAIDGRDLSDTILRYDDPAAMVAAVAATPGALGMVPYSETGLARPLALRDACGFIATPLLTALKTEDYPLTAPLFLYLPNRRLPEMGRDFLAWLRGPQAQLVVRRAGFVDQGAVPIPLDAQGQRFANAIVAAGEDIPLAELQRMVRVLAARTRMSTSFRFEVGATRLNAQSRSNLLLLGQAISDGQFAGQSLMLVGFSDGRGPADANRDLASARAEAVKRALTAVLGDLPDDVTVETEAFGEALPMGCDDTEWGRQMNRRVELWVTQ